MMITYFYFDQYFTMEKLKSIKFKIRFYLVRNSLRYLKLKKTNQASLLNTDNSPIDIHIK